MINIFLNTDEFEADIRGMVKAFYPEEFLYVEMEECKTEQQKMPKDQRVEFSIKMRLEEKDLWVWIKSEEKSSEEKNFDDKSREYHTVMAKEPRGVRKNDVKRFLYKILSEKTGRTLPWGTLTGIRPTKILMKGIEEGQSKQYMEGQMRETYLLSKDKFDMGYEIAKRESEILSRLSEDKGYSLYVNIPFCPTTCLYCSFTSFPEVVWKDRMDEYVCAVKKELSYVAEAMKGRQLDTVYFGGGTPTTLAAGQLSELIAYIRQHFDTSKILEFTIEAGRPDSITKEKLQAIKDGGVTRISINPQTMKQKTLDLIGRKHRVNQTIEAFQLARECGFTNINMDLIMGLPEESIDDVRETLEKIQSLGPDNLTVHSLAIKRTSRLNLEKGRYAHLYFDDARKSMELSRIYAEQMGLVPYYLYRQKNMAGNQENVGYAKPGKEGIYNILIMEERQNIIAVGAGAITKIVTTPGVLQQRVENVKDVGTYLSRTEEMIERKRAAFRECGLA